MEALTAEQAARVHSGLDQQAGGVERLRAELDEGHALRVYGQGAPGLTVTWPAWGVRVGKWLHLPKAAPRAPAEASVSDGGSQGWARVADLPSQRLAEVLWNAHWRAHGYSALYPLANTRPRHPGPVPAVRPRGR